MIAATGPHQATRPVRLLVVDPVAAPADHALAELPALLAPGDLVVVNDSATLPAALRGATADGAALEVRLIEPTGPRRWRAALLGAGDWRVATEARPAPPALTAGAALRFDGLGATVVVVEGRRLLELELDRGGAAMWTALYRAGRPVQYAYLQRPLTLWDVQTVYAGVPWAAEPPSAGLALTWELLLGLRRRGVELARVTHAAGLSSIGDAADDRALPLPERSAIGAEAVAAIGRTRARRGRVVAIGTTVVRALEGVAAAGGLRATTATTTLRLGPGHRRAVVDAIVSGVHERGTSHLALLEAFAPRAVLERALVHAEAAGYLGHEFGDAVLVLGAPPPAALH